MINLADFNDSNFYVSRRLNDKSRSHQFDVGEFLIFVGGKMASRKFLKLNGTP